MSLLRRAVREARGWSQFNWRDLFAPGQIADTTWSGVPVSQDTAMTCSAVYAAVDLIASTIASLPCDVFERYPNGTRYGRPRPPWMLTPTTEMDWGTWVQQMMVSLLLDGNAFVGLVRERGRLVSLWPLDPRQVVVRRDEKTRRLLYELHADGRVTIVEARDMLHVRGLTMPGAVRGMSPVERARQSIGRALAAEKFAGKLFANMAMPGSIITTDQRIDEKTAKELAERYDERHKGAENAFRTVVLGSGAKVEVLQLTPEQVQMLEVMRYSVSDVARWYRVPPHMIGDVERSTSWGTGIAEQNQMLATFTLAPWTVRLQRALDPLLQETVLNPDFGCKFDLRALMRGRPDEQATYMLRKIQARAATPNEWRAIDDENPLPGGDDPLLSVQWQPQ